MENIRSMTFSGVKWIVVLLVCTFCFCSANDFLTPVINLNDGSQIQGLVSSNPGNPSTKVWEFLGVPFAKPTDDQLRFKPTEPYVPWSGVFQAVKHGPICQQLIRNEILPDVFPKDLSIEEDCLYLTVWVPAPCTKCNETLLPVMVVIHGGGFHSGSTYRNSNGTKTLAGLENIVVVSIAYRLSIFGFLYSGGPEAPGNMGLLDQLEGLKWVHNNIKNFRGDPNQVTLIGLSAGSASVSLHALSPLSERYFNRLILQSGVATNPWAVTDRKTLRLNLVRIASRVGCDQCTILMEDGEQHIIWEVKQTQADMSCDQLSETFRCLASKPAKDLLDAFKPEGKDFMVLTMTSVLDGYFLKENPAQALDSGLFKKTDIMLGTTMNEATFFLFVYYPTIFEALNRQSNITEALFKSLLERTIPRKYRDNEFIKLAVYVEYRRFSLKTTPDDRTLALNQLGSDVYFMCDTNQWAKRYNEETNGGNVFRYVFDYSKDSLPEWQHSLHASDWPFVFAGPIVDSGLEDDVEMSKRMMRFWANFIRTGNPNINPDGSSTSIYWPAFGEAENYALLRLNQTNGNSYRERECYFWRHLVPCLERCSNGSSTTPTSG